MLKTLTLENFKPHRTREIRLSGGVTTLVGPTDVGKSSIIGALRWLALNRPSGESVKSWGQDHVSVTLELLQGKARRKIVRERGKSVNQYVLDNKELKALGGAVPEEITKLMNLGDESFQGQHVPHYWLSETAGAVSRELNRIVNLDEIDKVLDHIAKGLRAEKATREVVLQRIEKAEAETKELAWMEEAASELEVITKRQEKLDKLSQQAASLQSIVKSLEGFAKIRKPPDNTDIEKLVGSLLAKQEQAKDLAGLLQQIELLQDRVQYKAKEIKKLEKQLAELGPNCPVCGQKTPSSPAKAPKQGK